MTPDELFVLIESTHWTHRHVASVLGYEPNTLRCFVTGKRQIPDALTKKRVKELIEAEMLRIYDEFMRV